MGQYYLIVNLDKEEYVHPENCGDGMKFKEFGLSTYGVMMALGALLLDGNDRGYGDIHSPHPAIGSWAGDRIVIAGDYADQNARYPAPAPYANLFEWALSSFRNVSTEVMTACLQDPAMSEGKYLPVDHEPSPCDGVRREPDAPDSQSAD